MELGVFLGPRRGLLLAQSSRPDKLAGRVQAAPGWIARAGPLRGPSSSVAAIN